jgi:uncharacterized repeat protein (TIGR03803 family)
LGNYVVLHTFEGPEGAWPQLGLVPDSQGNLYGATTSGSTSTSTGGTVFKLDPAGTFSVLRSFIYGGSEGSEPTALIRDKKGFLYLSNFSGGSLDCLRNIGCGTVLKMDKAGHVALLHTFTAADGGGGCGSLVLDNGDNLYGAASGSGITLGALFELTQQ